MKTTISIDIRRKCKFQFNFYPNFSRHCNVPLSRRYVVITPLPGERYVCVKLGIRRPQFKAFFASKPKYVEKTTFFFSVSCCFEIINL